MSPSELTILLPCHSLEDFPLELTGPDAEGLLAGWSALWHPRLIAAVGQTLRWYRADYPPDELAGRLVVIPGVSERLLLTGWLDRVREQAAAVICSETDRGQIVNQALAVLDPPLAPDDPELVADFLALGYAYLQLELLTRQMRYISNLDEVHFEQQIVAAARTAAEGRADEARDHLRNTFDVLMEGRERFYPVDSYLLDLTLVAPTTLGPALEREVSQPTPVNLLLSGSTSERLAKEQPATCAAVRQGLESGHVSLIGGEFDESPLPLSGLESIRAELARGAAAYEQSLGRRPQVFGRRTAGLFGALPQVLSRSNFIGSLHTTLDEGRIAQVGQSKARWQGWDHSSIDACGRTPLDAREPGAFLALAAKLGETMDLDHVAALTFAHWPGGASPWYEDLRRVHTYAPIFGKFVTVDEFFGQTDTAGRFARLTEDDYQTPYLLQSVRQGAADPISRYVKTARQEAERSAISGLKIMKSALNPADTAAARTQPNANGDADRARTIAAEELSNTLIRGSDTTTLGTLLLNPFSFSRHEVVPLAAGDPHRGYQSIEVPGMGFAWIDRDFRPPPPANKKKPPKPLAHELTVGNEHLEIRIHPETGGIASVNDYRTRSNRLSQQLAYRFSRGQQRTAPDGAAIEYSTMQADGIEVTIADPAVGEIVSRGRLLAPEGTVLARFEQTVRVIRGSRTAAVNIKLETTEAPLGDPWNSYYASRFAWSNPEADLQRSIAGASHPTKVRRLEAPHFVEIRDERTRTAILTGGAPFHRRTGERMLDTLLIAPGETQREFRLGIGVDLISAETAALGLMAGPLPRALDVPAPGGSQAGWLFKLESTHAVATSWEPRMADDTGRATGFRVRIQETEGKPGRARLLSCRKIRAARQVDLLGQPLVELRLADDGVALDIGAFEYLQVEAEWDDG